MTKMQQQQQLSTWTIHPFKLDSNGFFIHSLQLLVVFSHLITMRQCVVVHLLKNPLVASVCAFEKKNNKHLHYILITKTKTITMTIASLKQRATNTHIPCATEWMNETTIFRETTIEIGVQAPGNGWTSKWKVYTLFMRLL